jgi:hypothetical protein
MSSIARSGGLKLTVFLLAHKILGLESRPCFASSGQKRDRGLEWVAPRCKIRKSRPRREQMQKVAWQPVENRAIDVKTVCHWLCQC